MTEATHSTEDPESELISLLGDLQTELATALNSLAGKYPRAIGDRYHLNAGGYINRAAEGYLLLRTRGRIDASKLLIRPAIEAMIRVQALRNKPELLYDIAYSEALEDKKWFRPAAVKYGIELSEKVAPDWEKFETAYKAQFPNAAMTKDKFTLYAAAKAAGLLNYYDTYYRMYCQYTHAALRATGGYLDDLADPEDTRVMIFCTYCALSAVAEIGAVSPNLESLHSRVDDLSKSGPIKLVRRHAE
jgi:hypothetical protein